MAEFVHVDRIRVSLWGRPVGTLLPSPTPGVYAFAYDYDFLKSGLEISPVVMPLSERVYQFPDLPKSEYYGLPPVFADSLPDSFGNALIDRWMRERGIEKNSITALDRLAYVGDRSMGALTYEPEMRRGAAEESVLDMRRLVDESRRALNADFAARSGDDALREIIRVGTSAGGAQAKAVVGWNRTTGEFLAGDGELPDGFEHWLIKFSPRGLEEAGEKEYGFYEKALACGITMSECRLYELDGVRHFMTKRFDRENGKRLHMQTACALAAMPRHIGREFRSYEHLFTVLEEMNFGYETLEQLFRRMAFNVLTREMDDHTKNFSFLMRENGRWELAPAYDLTGYHFSPADAAFFDFENQHALSVNGKFSAITDDDLLAVAERFAIGTAKKVLQQMHSTLNEGENHGK